ncbi:lactonase family protein [Streptomyces daliensis]|uniref:Lactonase family protein n=1 Tax=Streptomyces daliensis TaxID=299421 RepID=A0A8T4IWN4_9ACTN|nr:lactonase family protein [Streptomyces daliensis]
MGDGEAAAGPPVGARTARRGDARTAHAYLGSFTSAGGHGITTASADPVTGELTALHHTGSAVADPSYLALGAGVLYAVSETTEGAAAAFSLARPERPAPLGGPVPVRGAGPTHLASAGGRLFTANYTSGSVSALPLRADGSLGGQARVRRHEGRGPVAERQEGPHAHAVAPDPSGRWLLAVDLGTDSVHVYDLRDGSQGPDQGPDGEGPLPHREVPLRAGTGPRHLVFHPGGARAYVINELAPTVTTCRWNAADGSLESLRETALLPTEPTGDAPAYPSALVLSADGRFAWAAVRGRDHIAVLALGADGDGMELVTAVPCGGHWPRDLALHPSGRWLYVANERSGDIARFTLDPASGVPAYAGSFPAPAASCVVFAPGAPEGS